MNMDDPKIKGIMDNPEMINSLLEGFKKNPESLKGMASMMGENNPAASFL